MNRLLLFIIAFSSNLVFAQGYSSFGARFSSMGNAVVTMEDVWSYHHNPAGTAGIKSFSAGVSYENRFLLRELQSQGLAVAIPLKVGVVSVGAQFYGNRMYRSQRAGVGYSMKLAEKFYAGVQINYQGMVLADYYGRKHGVTAEAGVIGYITDDWKIGASVQNIGRLKLSDYQDDRYSTVFRLGTSYALKKVLFALEVEKEIDYKLRTKFGVEYEPVDKFYLRFGAGYNPIDVAFGAGYRWKGFQIDLGSAYTQVLGFSPHFSLTYYMKEKK